ncbi:hypothetical protein [Nonomuraea guangzhouensis]|uniref:Uncharacterized protein n=1 Tax=Nonomuraea guangzhouensis TaxID=1291555 RepID=A0ABW4GWE2_9ACTN|nr:hypothetical protein [Nonomuraea guangzhouensis]
MGIDTQVIAEYQAAMAGRKAIESAGEFVEDLLAGPVEPAWTAHCNACESNTCGYTIESGDLRTYKDLVKWTAHLMGKTWFAATGWDHMLESLIQGTDTRIREVSR